MLRLELNGWYFEDDISGIYVSKLLCLPDIQNYGFFFIYLYRMWKNGCPYWLAQLVVLLAIFVWQWEMLSSEGWFNMKTLSYQYRKSHSGDNIFIKPSHLDNGISYAGKMESWYWISLPILTALSYMNVFIFWVDISLHVLTLEMMDMKINE